MKEQLQQALVAVKNGDEERARVILANLLKSQPDSVPGWILLSKLAQTKVQQVAFLRKVLELDPDNQYATVELSILEEESRQTTGPVLVAETDAGEAEGVSSGTAEIETPVPEELAPGPEMELAPAPEAKVPQPEAETLPEADDESSAASPVAAVPTGDSDEETTEAIMPAPPALPVSDEPFDYDAQAEGETLPPWLADDEAVLTQIEADTTAEEKETPPPANLPDWLQEEPEQEWLGEEEPAPATKPAGAMAGAQETTPAARAPQAKSGEVEPATGLSGIVIGLGILLIIVFLLLVYTLLSFI